MATARGRPAVDAPTDPVYRGAQRRRSALDAVLTAGFAAVVAVGLALTTTAQQVQSGLSAALVAVFGLLAPSIAVVVVGAVQVACVFVFLGAPVALALTGRLPVLIRVIAAFALTLLVFSRVETSIGRAPAPGPSVPDLDYIVSTAWPSTGVLAGYMAAAMVTGPALTPRWRRPMWAMLALLVLHRVVVVTSVPTDLVLAIGIGGMVGSAVLLIFGRSVQVLTDHGIEDVLARAGLGSVEVRPGPPGPVQARTPSGDILVKVIGEHDRRVARLAHAYRSIRFRGTGGAPALQTTGSGGSSAAEAVLGFLASARGVRVPQVRAVAQAPGGESILATEDVGGTPLADVALSEITDAVLDRCWAQVVLLRRARIAHHELRLDKLLLDEQGRVWVADLQRGEASADTALAGDVAELLASSAARVGPVRAVRSAHDALGDSPLTDALARLVPAALTSRTRSELGKGPEGLQSLVDEMSRVTGVTRPVFAEVERVKPRTLIIGVMLAVAVYLLAPQLANFSATAHTIRTADVWWLPAVLLASFATYAGAGLGLAGSTPGRVSATEAAEVALASSFVATFTPPGVGTVGLNIRYLQKKGYATPVAISSSAAKEASVVVVHLVLLGVFAVWASRTSVLTGEFSRLPPFRVVAAVAGGVLVVLGIALTTSRVRGLLRRSVLPAVRLSVGALHEVVTRPGKLLMLVGGVILLPLGYLLCLYAALQAVGAGLSLPAVGVVSLIAGSIAAATPVPGGIGAVEAVLLASLTGLGVTAAIALAAVLLYRLATFWLPIAPGALVAHRLQRRDVL